ncbi:MAG: hypothetical protein WBB29_18665 [Geitlerinemataceae cyanobacterium]
MPGGVLEVDPDGDRFAVSRETDGWHSRSSVDGHIYLTWAIVYSTTIAPFFGF